VTVLETSNLTMQFGGLTAVNRFDMEVMEGEILGLIGPNGAGKTTIFNVISGVYRPTEGQIFFEGEDITGYKPHQTVKRGISRTFQQTTLFNNFTVLDNILVGLYLEGRMGFLKSVIGTASTRRKDKELRDMAMEILTFSGLEGETEKIATILPHGQKRSLGVAIALASYPTLLLLDEPMTGMNAQETEDMMSLIRKVRDDRGITSVIVEHNMKAVMGLCDRVVVLDYGAKLAVGSPREVVDNPAVIEAYLGGSANVV
jgi:branched-chain amino acid transport system ATP-binding protein